eukprot:184616_1
MGFMDTIHCYWQHCYDIGNKLSLKERLLCDNSDSKSENDFTHQKIQNIREILQRKDIFHSNMRVRYSTSYKYEQLSLFMKEKKNKSAQEWIVFKPHSKMEHINHQRRRN